MNSTTEKIPCEFFTGCRLVFYGISLAVLCLVGLGIFLYTNMSKGSSDYQLYNGPLVEPYIFT